MKKQTLFSGILALIIMFSGCEPNKDILDELDEIIKEENADFLKYQDKIPAVAEYTLTEADYALSDNSGVRDYKNFSDYDPAKDNLPYILDQKFFSLAAGTEMIVSYNYYRGSSENAKYVDDPEEYELVTADYDAMGEESGEPGKYDNFSSSTLPVAFIPDWLLTKYPAAVDEDNVKILYQYYAGTTTTEYDFFYFLDGVWHMIPESYELVSDDYDSMGPPGNYNNFDSSIPPNDYVPTFLALKFPYAKADDNMVVVYRFYEGGGVTVTEAREYVFDGTEWAEYQSVVVASSIFKFTADGWLFVPPIKFIKSVLAPTITYTLNDDDYEMIGEGKYDNFDLRAGKIHETEEARIASITLILKARFNIVVGDVFEVTYDYYDGANGTDSIVLEAVSDE